MALTFNPLNPAKQLLDIAEEIADINSTDRASAKEKLVDQMINKQTKAIAKAHGSFVIPDGKYAGVFLLLMNEKLATEEYFDFFATAFAAIQGKPYFHKFAFSDVGGEMLPEIQVFAESDTFPANVIDDVPKLKNMNQSLIVEAGLVFNPKPQSVETPENDEPTA